MIHDLQKANLLKRISAWLLDLIILVILIAGAASLIAVVSDFDSCITQLEDSYAKYEGEYGITFEMNLEDYESMTEEDKANYDAAYEALIQDHDAMYAYNMVVNLTLLISSLSILVGMLVTEFVIPLILKNGQTIGKKIFGIAVMRTNSVQIGAVSLFTRALLGKYTLETMIPVLVVLMLMFNVTGLMGTLLVLAIGITQVVMLCVTKTNSLIHDKLADTVVVDLASQMIFATEEDLLDYKKRMSADNAAQASYF